MAAVAVDQMTKAWALHSLTPGEITPLIGTFISLQLVFNPGAAFSFLAHSTWLFTGLSIAMSLVIVYLIARVRSLPWALSLGFLLGGALGNLIDRLSRPPGVGIGHVVDFLNWNGFFVGNIADIWITVSAAVILFLIWRGVPLAKRNPAARSEVAESDVDADAGEAKPL